MPSSRPRTCWNYASDDVTFVFDVGIPEAPNSTVASETGVRMRRHACRSGWRNQCRNISYPLDWAENHRDHYRVTYDLWMNANGPLPGAG